MCIVAFTDAQNKFIELSMVAKDNFTLILTKFAETSFTLSTSVQYGDCNMLNLKKKVSGANDSVICVVINNLPSREVSCFIATCMTESINYPINIRGEFKGESVLPNRLVMKIYFLQIIQVWIYYSFLSLSLELFWDSQSFSISLFSDA